MLVSAADEEAVIGARVRNLLEQQSRRLLRDRRRVRRFRATRTAAEARNAGAGRARVVEFPERRGKASVLNDLVATSSADVLVFTDANTRFDPGAVAELLRSLSGPRVGRRLRPSDLRDAGRRGRDSRDGSSGTAKPSVKEAEGRLGVCLGANGAIYAARRELVPVAPGGHDFDGRFSDSGRHRAARRRRRLRGRRRRARGARARHAVGGVAAFPHRRRRRSGAAARAMAVERPPAAPSRVRVLLAQGRALARAGPAVPVAAAARWRVPPLRPVGAAVAARRRAALRAVGARGRCRARAASPGGSIISP